MCFQGRYWQLREVDGTATGVHWIRRQAILPWTGIFGGLDQSPRWSTHKREAVNRSSGKLR